MRQSVQTGGGLEISAAASGRAATPEVRRYSATAFLVSLVLVIVVFSFLQVLPWGTLFEAGLMTLVLLAGVWAVGGRTRTLAIAALLALPAVAGKWLDLCWPNWLPAGSFLIPGIACGLFVAGHLLRFVLTAPRVDHEVLSAGMFYVATLIARLVSLYSSSPPPGEQS